jgi:hypothetical protein
MERFFWQRLVTYEVTVRHAATIAQLRHEWSQQRHGEKADIVMDYMTLPVKISLTSSLLEEEEYSEGHIFPEIDPGPLRTLTRARVHCYTAGSRKQELIVNVCEENIE